MIFNVDMGKFLSQQLKVNTSTHYDLVVMRFSGVKMLNNVSAGVS